MDLLAFVGDRIAIGFNITVSTSVLAYDIQMPLAGCDINFLFTDVSPTEFLILFPHFSIIDNFLPFWRSFCKRQEFDTRVSSQCSVIGPTLLRVFLMVFLSNIVIHTENTTLGSKFDLTYGNSLNLLLNLNLAFKALQIGVESRLLILVLTKRSLVHLVV